MDNAALAYARTPIPAARPAQFARIVFLTDLSKVSLKGLAWAGAMARGFNSELRLVYALTPGDYLYAVNEFDSSATDIIKQTAKARLLALRSSPELDAVKKVTTQVFAGGLNALYSHIGDDDIGLAVVASHGSKGVRHLLLGSVSEDLIHRATCPVLTVGPRVESKNTTDFHPKHVLLATDTSPDSFRALPYAILFGQEHGSELTVVHVLSEGQHGTPEADAFAALMRDGLHHALSSTVIQSCNPEIVVTFGNAVEQILSIARERRSELIVMGARSSTNRAAFNRSVSYGVITQARCPVLTVRGRK
jgi:nucleotide-binding universal stress UspA family protein